MAAVSTTPFTEKRVTFDVSCPRCAAPVSVDAQAVGGAAILISIDPCTACSYSLPLERWAVARTHARRLLRGEA
ncbi:MAG TPA: hypothetical protein VF102_07115 [Gemmatimonadaceae bacterium]